MSGHAVLKIVNGIQKTPSDTSSAEQGLDEINLLDPSGFSVDSYAMKIPALKSGTVYADSPLTDGRTLIAGVLGNVSETLRVTLTAASIAQMTALLSKLGRFKQNCNNFWDTFGQIEPVYIKHQIVGEPGPRYALLYDIDIAIEPPFDPSVATRDLTIVIEREYGWRGIAPGDNPKRWYIENVAVGQNWNTGTADLSTGDNHLASTTLANKLEFGTVNSFSTKNHIDVDGSLIPGDLPALVCLTVKQIVTGDAAHNLFIGKDSKPLTLTNRDSGNQYPRYNTFAAAAGTMGADTSLATDSDGIIYNPTSANARRARISFATDATIAPPRVTWAASTLAQTVDLLRGRYAVFLRARQNNGVSGNTSIVVEFYEGAGALSSYTILPIVATGVQLHYVGVVGIPVNNRQFVGINGQGLYNPGTGSGAAVDIRLYASRSTGVATLDIFDLVFMPIDEGSIEIVPTVGISSSDQRIIYDNTGYFSHGYTESVAEVRNLNGANLDNQVVCEQRGSNIELTPGVNNRLYFLMRHPTTNNSPPQATMQVRLNIVPRWSGLRDV